MALEGVPMGGLQGWHILMLLMMAVVTIVVMGLAVVIVLKVANRPKVSAGVERNGLAPQGSPAQIG